MGIGIKGDFKEGIYSEVNESVKALENLFPSAVKDGQVDFQALKEMLGEFEEVGAEKYELTWSGKKDAKKVSQQDIIAKTLKYIPEDSVNPDTTENLYIEGDNLEVLKLLRQNYYGAVKMIYIDPPYNTGSDFVYNDKFSIDKEESDIEEGDVSELGERYIVNTDSSNRYHANWLNMMYPRLKIAKDLLKDDGVIFISIDEKEIDNLKKICDEIFQSNNYRNTLVIKRNSQNQTEYTKTLNGELEFILVYSKSNLFKYTKSEIAFDKTQKNLIDKLEKNESITKTDLKNIKKAFNMVSGDSEWKGFYTSKENRPTMQYPILGVIPYDESNPIRRWMWGENRTKEAVKNYEEYIKKYSSFSHETITKFIEETGKSDFVRRSNDTIQYYKIGKDCRVIGMNWTDIRTADGSGDLKDIFTMKIFDNPKPTTLLRRLIDLTFKENENGIILDFFAGSASTAHTIINSNMEMNKLLKFIMIQIPQDLNESLVKSDIKSRGTIKNAITFLRGINKKETLAEIGKERIRRVGKKILEENKDKEGIDNLDIGFKVFRVSDTNIRWVRESEELESLNNEVMSKEAIQQTTFNYIAATTEATSDKELSAKDKLDFMPGFKDIDVVYELILRQRDIPLSAKVVKLDNIGQRTYIFDDSFLVCLEEEINNELIEKLASINPLPIKFILRDSAFGDDINLKDETNRRLKTLIERNTGENKKTYTVEYI